MAGISKQPANADVITKDGQLNQGWARWLLEAGNKAGSAIQSFAEIFTLDTVDATDAAADYLLLYDASSSSPKKVLASDLLASGSIAVIETKSVTASGDVEFTNIPQTYKTLFFKIIDIRKDTSFGTLTVRFSDDNGSSYATGILDGTSHLARSGSNVPAAWSADFANAAYVSDTGAHGGYFKIAHYAEASTVAKEVATELDNKGVDNSFGLGVIYGLGPINAVKFSLPNFVAEGSIVLIGYP